MPMGDSGGRSAGNRQGDGAKRRNTPRERADIDPPWDIQPPPTIGERLMLSAVWGALLLILVIFVSVAATLI